MNHKIILFAFLFSITLESPTLPTTPTIDSTNKIQREELWLPMNDNSKYGNDICHYKEIDEKLDYEIHYAKPCKEGQYCDNLGIEGQPFDICRDLPEYIKLAELGESCNESKDCINGLSCIDGKCTRDCGTGRSLYRTYYSSYVCYDSTYITQDNLCYDITYGTDSSGIYTNFYDFKLGEFKDNSKSCGKINPTEIKKFANNKNKKYVIKSVEPVSVGEVEDGNFVLNAKYCKSGFALFFYLNEKTTNPGKIDITNQETNFMFLRCVTPVKTNDNVVTYKIGEGNEENYNINNIGTVHYQYKEEYLSYIQTGNPDDDTTGSLQEILSFDDLGIEYAIIKNEIMKEYLEEFEDLKDDVKVNCTEDFDNRCTDGDVVKAMYFYKYPKEYLFYHDRKILKKVLYYKIQDKYHSFSLSKFINLNYLVLLLTLLLI